ncbi:MAG: chorismate-binding protein [Silvanigrellaceae bacterium]|nr:chorismate-binding protein [Silvanigrellaceae bacterium]
MIYHKLTNDFYDKFLYSGLIIMDPFSKKVSLGLQGKFTAEKKENENLFYINDFFSEKSFFWNTPLDLTVTTLNEFEDFLKLQLYKKPQLNWLKPDLENYQHQFLSLMELISQGHLSKGVPYSSESAHYISSSEHLTYLLLHACCYLKQAQGYLYGFWNQEEGILGVTPEILFQKQNLSVQTIALAGSRKNTLTAQDEIFYETNMLQDKKIKHEHEFVKLGILNDLKHLGECKVEDTEVVRLPHMSHLKTGISVFLNTEIEFHQLVSVLHPTPALGVWPKNLQGNSWLRSCNLMLGRGYHGAPIGFQLSAQKAFCLVAIRNVQWNNCAQNIKIVAGGGVVLQSILQDEWQEALYKIQSVKNIFCLNPGDA